MKRMFILVILFPLWNVDEASALFQRWWYQEADRRRGTSKLITFSEEQALMLSVFLFSGAPELLNSMKHSKCTGAPELLIQWNTQSVPEHRNCWIQWITHYMSQVIYIVWSGTCSLDPDSARLLSVFSEISRYFKICWRRAIVFVKARILLAQCSNTTRKSSYSSTKPRHSDLLSVCPVWLFYSNNLATQSLENKRQSFEVHNIIINLFFSRQIEKKSTEVHPYFIVYGQIFECSVRSV